MKKIKFLARKLKAFGFNDIFLLAEMPKAELEKILKALVKEKVLKETSQGYIYCEINYMPPSAEPVVKGETVKFVQDDDYLKFKSRKPVSTEMLTQEELEIIPEYNRKKYEKYIKLLKITKNLHGNELQEFIQEYNLLNPSNKTSYATIMKKRRAIYLHGTSSLVAKYGKARKLYYPDMERYYEVFKKFYFSDYHLTFEQCRRFTANELKIPLENMPSGMTFRRRLYKDYTRSEIKIKRREICF